MNKIVVLIIIISMISISTISVASPFKSRIRIIDVDFEDETIKVEESFNIEVTLTKQRYLKFNGEIHVYLTFSGLMGENVGEKTPINIPRRRNDSCQFYILCNISDVEADWYQETFGLKIVVYEKVLGYLIKKDSYSIESIRVVSKFWEKDKLSISRFEPPETWYSKTIEIKLPSPESITSALPDGPVDVYISNDAYYKYNVTVVIYLIEKTSMNIPFIEGIGHYRKEIGRNDDSIKPGEEDIKINVDCHIDSADIDEIDKKRTLDVQAVLFAEVDRELVEVDSSSIHTSKVRVDDIGEWITVYGPWIWIIFVAALATFILLLVTFKLIIPFTQLKGDEVQEAVEKVRKKRRGGRRNDKGD